MAAVIDLKMDERYDVINTSKNLKIALRESVVLMSLFTKIVIIIHKVFFSY